MKPTPYLIAALFFGLALCSHSTTITWNGSTSTQWNNPTNWIPQQVPTASDTVVFNSGSLTAPTNSAFAVMNWTGGNLYGALTVASNAVLNLSGPASRQLLGALTNAGTVTITATGYLQLFYLPASGYSGAIYNLPGGLCDIQNDQFYFYNVTGNEFFSNAGTLRKSAGSGTTQIYPRLLNATGLVDTQSGTLSFVGGGTISGGFSAAAGATVAFNGGSCTDGGPTQFTGAGAFKFMAGTLTLLNNTIPNLQLLGGTLVLGPAFQGGTITNLTVTGITMQFTNTVSGVFNWTGGNLYGALTVASNAVLNLSGPASRQLLGALTNAGTVTITATGYLQLFYLPASGYSGAIYNLPGGLCDIQNDQFYFYNVTGNEFFSNAGTLRKSAGSGTTQIYPRLLNATGLVDAQSGTLSFVGGGTISGGFSAAAGATVAFNGGSCTDGGPTQFTGAGAFKFMAGTLTLLNNTIPNLQLLGGTLVLGPAFQGGTITNLTVTGITMQFTNTVSGVFNWTGGNLYGALTVASNAVLNLSGPASRQLLGALTNAGTVTITATGYLQLFYLPASGYSGAIYNLPGGLCDIQNDQFYFYNVTGNEFFSNAGTLRKSAGSGTTQIYPRLLNATGLVDAQSGTLSFVGGGTISGGFSAAAGATVAFNGGSCTDGGPTQFTGAGAFKFMAGTLTLLNNTIPNLQLLGGTLVLGPAFQGGTITNLTVTGITMQFTNTVSGVFNWTGGNLYGALTVASNAVLNLSGPASRQLLGALTNAGTVTITATGYLQLFYLPASGYSGAIYNLPGGLCDIQNDQFYFYNVTGNEFFSNAGTLRKSAGSGTTQIYPRLLNATGLVDAQSGTLSLLSGLDAGNGELRSGLSSLSSFGKISIAGNVTLGGTIGVALLGGYVPAVNNTFAILSYGSRAGGFNNFDLPGAALWSTNYTATTFSVTVASINNLPPAVVPQWTADGFRLTLNGPNNLGSVIIYASTNLMDWKSIYTNPPTTGIIQFLDTESKNLPARFYRAVEQ